jgi:hypothetical protein
MSGRQNSYPIEVDYGGSITELIHAGQYDWPHADFSNAHLCSDVSESFAAVVCKLVKFDRCVSSDQAVRGTSQVGLRPATTIELLTFGARYPMEQLKCTIVALGSSSRKSDCRDVPFLFAIGPKRGLELDRWDVKWLENFRFLAV